MKPRTFVMLLGLALLAFGIIWGATPKSATYVSGYGIQTVDCGMSFTDVEEQTQERSANLVGAMSNNGYRAGSITEACDTARKPWLAWTGIALGGVILLAGLFVMKRPDEVQPTPGTQQSP